MKELSIEEKAEAYDEAIEKGRQIQNTPYTAHWDIMKEVVEHLLPELKESEDERIRKNIISWLKNIEGQTIPIDDYNSALAWLEKQGEHANFRNKIQIGDKVTRNEAGILVNISQLNRVAKPAKRQIEQKPTYEEMKEALRTEYEKGRADAIAEMQKSAWSEEDEKMLGLSVENLTELKDRFGKEYGRTGDCIDWLKFLKAKCTWKPSKEQMEFLLKYAERNNYDGSILTSLYQDLKKLKG